MNYYYDILINLSDNKPLEFYEWLDTDPIEHVKKIPLFRVKSKVIKDFLLNNIVLDEELINKIYLKTESLYDKVVTNVDYMFLLTDTKCALVVEANIKGEVIYLSKLLLNEELNLLEISYAFDEEEINYSKQSLRKEAKGLRIEHQVKKFLLCEIKTLLEKNTIDKLKYLYYEWTNCVEEDIDKIYLELSELINGEFTPKHYEMYRIIRLSYQMEK